MVKSLVSNLTIQICKCQQRSFFAEASTSQGEYGEFCKNLAKQYDQSGTDDTSVYYSHAACYKDLTMLYITRLWDTNKVVQSQSIQEG